MQIVRYRFEKELFAPDGARAEEFCDTVTGKRALPIRNLGKIYGDPAITYEGRILE